MWGDGPSFAKLVSAADSKTLKGMSPDLSESGKISLLISEAEDTGRNQYLLWEVGVR